ncbi:MAG: hypothetical protein ABF463_09295, partial [Ethanoligenens sp.]
AQGDIGPTGPQGNIGPTGPTGATGPTAIASYGSVMNNTPLTISTGGILTFNTIVSLNNTTFDIATSTMTLGTQPYYRVAFGVVVQSFTGTPSLEMVLNGVGSGVYLPINHEGGVSIDYISSYVPNSTIQFVVQGGSVTLQSPGGYNAYLTVFGFIM